MKKVLIALIVLSVGCGKIKISWMADKKVEPVIEAKKPTLKTDIAGVIFTFDDGCHLTITPKVLAILKKYNLQATFFVEGINFAGDSEQTKERRELLKREVAEGHIIGNHSYDHKLFTSLSPQKVEWEIDATNKLIFDTIGITPTLIRLPYGRSSKLVNSILKKKHLTPVFWSVDLQEYARNAQHQYKTKEELLQEFIKQFTNLRQNQGQQKIIFLIHDTKSITPEVLPLILDYLLTQ